MSLTKPDQSRSALSLLWRRRHSCTVQSTIRWDRNNRKVTVNLSKRVSQYSIKVWKLLNRWNRCNMSERQFLYSNKQIAIKNIFSTLPPPPRKDTISHVLFKNTICFRFHEVVTVTVDGKGEGSCLKTEKQCNAIGLLIFWSYLIWHSLVQESGKAVLHQLYQEDFENVRYLHNSGLSFWVWSWDDHQGL